MAGLDQNTGQLIGGLDRLYQSIGKILTTKIGTRVHRRDFGSNIPDLIDKPVNSEWFLSLYAEASQAIRKWEPEFIPIEYKNVHIDDSGKITIDIFGEYQSEVVSLKGVSLV